MKQWASLYLWDNSASQYVDLTFDAQDFVGSESPLMAEREDELYFSLDRTFNGIFVDITGSTNAYTEVPRYYYYNGTEWRRLPIQTNYNFREPGVLRFVEPPDWKRAILENIESGRATTNLMTEDRSGGTEKYWVKVNMAVEGDDAINPAMLRQSFPFPSYVLATPEECAALMSIRFDFTESTKPSRSDVELILRRVESYIEGITLNAWKPQYIENQLYEYTGYGTVLRRYPVIRLFSLRFWNGDRFEPLTEGRNQDYFVNPRTGEINFSRFIHLPFAYRRVRSYGFGQHRLGIDASYIWGRDELDSRYHMAKDAAIKLAVVDILASHDWTNLIPQGGNAYSIDQRIQSWREEAMERVEDLKSLRTFVA